MSIKSPLNRQFGTQFDSVFDVVKSNPMYDKSGGKIPSLDLNFAKSKSLSDSRSTKNLINFTRASTGTYVGSDGLIKTSPANYLKESKGLITGWLNSPANFIRTANYATAPDGTQTASRFQTMSGLVDPGNSAYTTRNYRAASVDYGVGAEVTISVYVKPITTTSTYPVVPPDGAPVQERDLFFWIQGEGGIGSFWFNLNTKETKAGSTAVEVGDGWWRFSCTGTTTVSDAVNNHFVYLSNRTAAFSFDPYPDGNEEVYVWGMQSELGSTATDFVPTTTTASGAPRFDHDPVTGESLGLLIEESRTNLVTYSEEFDNANWTKLPNASIITANNTTAPDGNPTADLVSRTANQQIVYQLSPGAGTYVFSVYAKAGSSNLVTLASSTSFRGSAVTFNLSNGVPGSVVSYYSGSDATITLSNPAMTDAGNGWWRCQVSVVHTTGRAVHFEPGDLTNTAASAYFWGAQLESGGSFPTSYIPTTSSAVTRAADVASITGTNFISFYDDSASTLYIESPNFPNYGNLSNGSFVYISDQNILPISVGDGIKFGTSSPATGTRIFVTEAGATQAQSLAGAGSKFAIAVSENDFAYTVDGAIEGTDNTVVMPTGMDRLVMTAYGPGLVHLSRLAYFPTRLPDDKLKSITT